MKNFKAIISIFISVSVMLSMLAVFSLTSSAETEDVYTYTVTDGKATITYVNTSISGDITIPSTLGGYPVVGIGVDAFKQCTSLVGVVIPNSVKDIGTWAFGRCSNLVSVVISDGVANIDSNAFNGCTSLKSIVIPDSVKSIGEGAFYNCTSLETIEIPDGVTVISNGVFQDCEGLTSVTLPDSIESIDDWAFTDCKNLKTILIPNGVADIGESAFQNCTNLESIIIPSSVENIGSGAFTYCTRLTKITIPYGVTDINRNLFQNCTSLKSVTLPDSVKIIDSYVFLDCTGLESITIPDGVTDMDDGVFMDCTNLKSVTIPNSVTTMGADVFANCTNLTVYCYTNSTAHTYAQNNSVNYVAVEKNTQIPTNPELLSKTETTITLTPTDGYEYKLGDGEWQSSNVFTGLNVNTAYTFYQRIARTETVSESVDSSALEISTSNHDFSVPQNDTEQHWNKCAGCDMTSAKENHSYGTDNKCTVCGQQGPVSTTPNGGEGENVNGNSGNGGDTVQINDDKTQSGETQATDTASAGDVESGCGSVIGGAVFVMAMLTAAAAFMLGKKNKVYN